MIIKASNVKPDSIVDADICIVGSGAAGLAFLQEFFDSSLKICVLESGNLESDTSTVDPLYEIEAVSMPISNASRKRVFGGTTAVWSGRWKRHDDIDFQHRPWIENSGWPIESRSLDQYYLRASEKLHAPNPLFETTEPTILDGGPFEKKIFREQSKKYLQWGKTFLPQLTASEHISVYCGAHVYKIVKSGSIVDTVHVKTVGGNEFQVRAKYVVLSAGGLENPRILLLSNIGNEYDQVGRYYMDHPKGRFGIVTLATSHDVSPLARSGDGGYRIGFRLSDEEQRKEKILNAHIFIEPLFEKNVLKRFVKKIFQGHKTSILSVRNYLEQMPSASNRVYLSAEKDPLGLPKVAVDWHIGELDKKSIIIFHERLKEFLTRQRLGSLSSPFLDSSRVEPKFEDASHHMGTTRMGVDPKYSVVDSNCKVHSIDNLFILGPSVLPTSGHFNPVALTAALSIRLADYMKQLV